MGIHDDVLARLRGQRADLQNLTRDIETGRHPHQQKRGSEWIDASSALLRECMEDLADTERLIAIYEMHNEPRH